MNREQVIEIVSQKIRLIRLEQDFSQEKMSKIIGVSKKTLVQIEKGRIEPNWNIVVTVIALFGHSEVLQNVLGDEPLEVIKLIAHDNTEPRTLKSLGGKVWWKEMEQKGKYRLQQNLISHHFRIIDELNFRYFCSFDKEESLKRLNELHSQEEK
ncbi:helix-turn-helix transcriptional regulator [Evansella sp. AB-rgal1]|uniref:helix-turn-helix transcriptional regulator n=1 Tax=Evansella sp. AB-rgal1 TaxID=3242696 RepID=UPI00359CCD93